VRISSSWIYFLLRKSKLRWLALIGLATVAMSCGHQSGLQGVVPPPISNSQARIAGGDRKIATSEVDRLIDKGVSADDREILRRATTNLRIVNGVEPDVKNFQIAVIDGRTGSVTVNRPELKGTFIRTSRRYLFQRKPQGLTSGRSAMGTRAPQFSGNPIPNSGTGPYRRLYTYPNFDQNRYGLASIAANVSVQCNAGNILNLTPPAGPTPTPKSAGHSFFGGWSMSDQALDAGLIYNKGINAGSQDDYSPFFAIQGYSGYQGDEYSGSSRVNWHIPCSDNAAFMSFYVDAPTFNFNATIELVTRYTYWDPGAGAWRQINLIFQTYRQFIGGDDNWQGWSPSCYGCVLKRVTSIAQTGDDFNNGDSFTSTWSNTKLSCGFFLYSGCQPGSGDTLRPVDANAIKACEEYPGWNGYDDGTRDCRNRPLSNSVSQVDVQNFQLDRSGETVLINLSPVKATPPPSPVPSSTRFADVFIFGSTLELARDGGLHVGMWVANTGTTAAPTAALRSFRFANTLPSQFQIYDATSNTLVYNSRTAVRSESTITWLTWQPQENIHFEAVWYGYDRLKSYYTVFTMVPMDDPGVSRTTIPYTLDRLPLGADVGSPIDTPVYATPDPSSCTPDATGSCVGATPIGFGGGGN
jgi:hypothetical protein